jgi:hypothetical protein
MDDEQIKEFFLNCSRSQQPDAGSYAIAYAMLRLAGSLYDIQTVLDDIQSAWNIGHAASADE